MLLRHAARAPAIDRLNYVFKLYNTVPDSSQFASAAAVFPSLSSLAMFPASSSPLRTLARWDESQSIGSTGRYGRISVISV